jgi:hypothetical protein
MTAGSLKATRLGSSSEFQAGNVTDPVSQTLAPQSSFLGNLNRKHYVLAGSALGLLFLGILTISLVLILKGSGKTETAESPGSGNSASPSSTPLPDVQETGQTISPEAQPILNDGPNRAPAVEEKQNTALTEAVPMPAAQRPRPSQDPRNSAAARERARRRALAQQALDK